MFVVLGLVFQSQTLTPRQAHEVKPVPMIEPAIDAKKEIGIKNCEPQEKPSETLMRNQKTPQAQQEKRSTTTDHQGHQGEGPKPEGFAVICAAAERVGDGDKPARK